MDPQIAWAAGLFEGEGCITHIQRRPTSGLYPVLQLSMTDFDVVQRFMGILGSHTQSIVKPRKEHHKPQLMWRTAKKTEVQRILSLFLPYFGQRRAYKALNILDELEIQ